MNHSAIFSWNGPTEVLGIFVSVWEGLWEIEKSCLLFTEEIVRSQKLIELFCSIIVVKLILEWIEFMKFCK